MAVQRPTPLTVAQTQPLGWPAGDADAGRVRAPRCYLPAQVSSFVGRERELLEISRLLSEARLLTITGPGGIGKTRLAFELVGAVRSDFRDDVILVELGSEADPQLVASRIAEAAGVRDRPSEPILNTLVRWCRNLDVLLVLDNCEHLLSACARVASDLLRACPTLRILCTSREQLGVTGEVAWCLPPLALPDVSEPQRLDHLAQADAIRLFVDRARAVAREFVLTEDNARAVVAICARLDGQPLAIELAASRTTVLTPTQIGERLDDRFALLTTGSRTAPIRHQTLRATMEWSYGLLQPSEQALLRQLSVFSGSFALEAAEAIAVNASNSSTVLDVLSQLVAKSLIVVEQHGDRSRYRQLETVRLYAHERLSESPEEVEVQQRHSSYFLSLAEDAESRLRGQSQGACLDRLQLEHDNLRAALRQSLASANAETALRLGAALWYFWYLRGHVREGYAWMDRALRLANLASPSVLAKALKAAGSLSGYRGNFAEAQARFEQALAIHEVLRDKVGTAAALNNLAVAETELGAYVDAQKHLERSLELRGEIEGNPGVAVVYGNLGWLAEARGDLSRALECHRQALAIWRATESNEGTAASLIWQAGILQAMGEPNRAHTMVDEGLDHARRLDSKPCIARGLRTLGMLAAERNDTDQAARLVRASLRIALEAGIDRDAVGSLHRLAGLALRSNEPVKATRMLAAAEVLSQNGEWTLHLPERTELESYVEWARRSLSSQTFLEAWSSGRRTPLPEFVGDDDSGVEDHAARRPALKSATSSLTGREVEVVRLIALGRSNRQLAENLVIAPTTAERHVANVLAKLGLHSRAQIAVWAIRNHVLAERE